MSVGDTLLALATSLPEATLPPEVPSRVAAQARLDAGIPALEGERLVQPAELLAGIETLRTALAGVSPAVSELDARLLEDHADELASMAQAGAWDLMAEWARNAGLDAQPLLTLADFAARPYLRAAARLLRDVLEQQQWSRGTCPACGAAPLLAELRSSGSAEGERVLRCGRCLTAWFYPRLRCAGCGESDHRRLSYLHGTGEEAYRRAEVCSSCGTYLKTIAVLAPLGLSEMLNADLATTALDLGAVELGFHR